MSPSQGNQQQSKQQVKKGTYKNRSARMKIYAMLMTNTFMYLTKNTAISAPLKKYYSNTSLQNMNICTHMAFLVV